MTLSCDPGLVLCPTLSVTALKGKGTPAKVTALLPLQLWGRFPSCKSNSPAPAGEVSPVEVLQLCSSKSVAGSQGIPQSHTLQQTSHERFIGREKPQEDVVSVRVRSSSKLSRDRVYIGCLRDQSFPEWNIQG